MTLCAGVTRGRILLDSAPPAADTPGRVAKRPRPPAPECAERCGRDAERKRRCAVRRRRRFGVAVLGLAALALLSGGAGRAGAAPIPIFNTGVSGAGAPLPDGTMGDPHYTLFGAPAGSTADLRVR